MATYILLTKLNPESMKDLSSIEENGKKWKTEVNNQCPEVKWIGHYSILGPYDFINILEARDDKAISKVAIELGSRGTLQTMTMAAMALDEFMGNR